MKQVQPAGHTTEEVDCTTPLSLGFLLKKICPGTEERPKPPGHLKSPQRLTVSKSLDNLNKGRIILWGCIFASLKSIVKLSQHQRSYDFTSELLGGDTAPGY